MDNIEINNSMKFAIELFAKNLFHNNKKVLNYSIENICGVGSNGCVFKIKDEDKNELSLKILNVSNFIIEYFRLNNKEFHKDVFNNIEKIIQKFEKEKIVIDAINRHVASFETDEEKKSFFREFNALRKINKNKYCTYLIDYGVITINIDNNTTYQLPFVIMPFLEGITLNELVEKNGLCDKKIAFSILKEVVNIIEYIHKYNIIHRDLYPNNFIYDENGNVKLLDFGASITDMDLANETIGERRGARRYMSPEQFVNPQKVCQQSDYFFIGGIIFFLLTSKTPFDRDREKNTFPKKVEEHLSSDDYDKEEYNMVCDFINKLMEYDADKRYENIRKIKKELNKIIEKIGSE